MNIIFSHYGVLDGGDACGFTRSFALASELTNLNNKVTFITTQKNGFVFPFKKEMRNGVEVIAFAEILPYRFRKGGFSILSTILKVIYVMFRKADVVHSDTGHRPSSGWPCIVHRFLYRSIYVSEWWEHFGKGGIYDDMNRFYQKTIGVYDNFFEEKNRLRANGCAVISSKLNERAIRLGVNKDNLLVLNGGSDIENIPFTENSNDYRSVFEISKDLYVIGIIGINKEELENHNLMFKAIERYNSLSENKIIVVCTGALGNILKNTNDIDHSIFRFYNWLPYFDFCNLVSCMDAFALVQKPNLRNESRFPNKLGDYLAGSRPIITNAIGEIKYYIDKYPDAFIKISNNLDENFEIMSKLVESKGKTQKLFSYIRSVAVENSWYQRACVLNDFYKKQLDNNATTHAKTLQR